MTAHTPQSAPTELRPVLSYVKTKDGRQTFMSRDGGSRRVSTYEPRCKTCNADRDVVLAIHEMATTGAPVMRILQIAKPAGISETGLRTHLKKHFEGYTVYETMQRSIAAGFGEGEPTRISGLHGSQMILETGAKAIADGRMKIRASDMIAAARYQHDMEVQESVVDSALYAEAIMIMFDHFYKTMGLHQYNAAIWGLSVDPRMSKILSAIGVQPGEVIETVEHDPRRDLISSL